MLRFIGGGGGGASGLSGRSGQCPVFGLDCLVPVDAGKVDQGALKLFGNGVHTVGDEVVHQPEQGKCDSHGQGNGNPYAHRIGIHRLLPVSGAPPNDGMRSGG